MRLIAAVPTQGVKNSAATMIIGMIMFAAGLGMFYSIETGQFEPEYRLVKNTGIFVGLAGIGATMAGVLLTLFSRSEPAGR